MMNANAFIKELKFVNGIVPEEFLEGLGEIGRGEVNANDEIGERDE